MQLGCDFSFLCDSGREPVLAPIELNFAYPSYSDDGVLASVTWRSRLVCRRCARRNTRMLGHTCPAGGFAALRRADAFPGSPQSADAQRARLMHQAPPSSVGEAHVGDLLKHGAGSPIQCRHQLHVNQDSIPAVSAISSVVPRRATRCSDVPAKALCSSASVQAS